MEDNFNKLYEEFLRIAESGDEDAAKKFLADHVNEFPEKTRDEILFAFFEEALLKKADAITGRATMQQQGMDAIALLQKAKKDLENDARIDELQSSLGGGETAV